MKQMVYLLQPSKSTKTAANKEIVSWLIQFFLWTTGPHLGWNDT